MAFKAFLKRIANDNVGGTAIEYGLIATLVVIASLGALKAMANEETNIWFTVSGKASEVMGNNEDGNTG